MAKNENYEEIFSRVLNNDESVLEIIKPQSTVYKLKCIVSLIVSLIFILVGAILASIIEIFLIFILGIGVFIFIISLIVLLLYKNLYYCITNKRLIIRSGLLGIDYKVLRLATIDTINIKVSVWDKLLKKNTATIEFANHGNPNNNENAFQFSAVENYDKYHRLINGLIEELNNKNQ